MTPLCHKLIKVLLVGPAWLWLLAACQPRATLLLPTPAVLAAPIEQIHHVATLPPASSTPILPTSLPPTYTPVPTPVITATHTRPPTLTPTPSCLQPGTVTRHQHYSPINGGVLNYRLYRPPCYGDDGRVYPTLYLLHGNDQSEAKWDQLGVDETANAGILAHHLPPFLIVMPQGGWAMRHTSGGTGSFEAVILEELIPHIEATTCAWADGAGRAIGGLSRGGYWALEIAFRHPMAFASVGGHSAALLDIAAGPELNPQYTGVTNALGLLRVYLDVGDQDWGSLPNLQRLHEDMENAGIPHEWHLNTGGHDDTYWSGQLTAYLNWYTAVWSMNRTQHPVCVYTDLVP